LRSTSPPYRFYRNERPRAFHGAGFRRDFAFALAIGVAFARKWRPASLFLAAEDMTTPTETLARFVIEARRVVVFTGAGVSTESGLPDYRGPDGVWTRQKKGLPPLALDRPWSSFEPNAAHRAIAALERLGKLDFLISQNVDDLHLKSGIPPEKLAELHGNMEIMKCLFCDGRFRKAEIGWDSGRFGEGYRTSAPVLGQPCCPRCGGRIISSVVNFGDPLPEREWAEALAAARRCDLLLAVGSSLSVFPAAELPVYALEAGARLAILNLGETPLDSRAHLKIESKAGEVLAAVVERVRAAIRP
jgi:NAD-dependent SIR2 family protein deacetylase